MLARGDLSHAQLRQVLDTQRQRGNGRIGQWIQKLGYAHEQQVTAALALQWSCPLLKVLPERAAECAVPLHLLKHFRMVPVHFARTSRILHLAFGGDIEYPALHAIEQMLGCKTEACLTISAALDAWLAQMDQETNPTDKVFNGKRGPEEMARITSSYALKLHADQVRTVVCGEFIWVRIEGSQDSANLLFLRKQTEVNSSSQKEILGRAAG